MPGWTSLATVQSLHGWLEAGALFFFTALVVFELLAHRKLRMPGVSRKWDLLCRGDLHGGCRIPVWPKER
jgi:hypothetical protein